MGAADERFAQRAVDAGAAQSVVWALGADSLSQEGIWRGREVGGSGDSRSERCFPQSGVVSRPNFWFVREAQIHSDPLGIPGCLAVWPTIFREQNTEHQKPRPSHVDSICWCWIVFMELVLDLAPLADTLLLTLSGKIPRARCTFLCLRLVEHRVRAGSEKRQNTVAKQTCQCQACLPSGVRCAGHGTSERLCLAKRLQVANCDTRAKSESEKERRR